MDKDENLVEPSNFLYHKLRESEEKWKRLAETAPDVILSVDCDGFITSINRAVPGLSIEDAVGKSADFFVPEEHRSVLREAIQKACRGERVDYELAGAAGHGKIAWYMGRVGPIEVDGKVIGATLMARDITERKEMEDALRRAHDELEVKVRERTSELSKALSLLQATLDSTTDGILVVNDLGKVTTLNRQCLKLWGIFNGQSKILTLQNFIEEISCQVENSNDFAHRMEKVSLNPDLEVQDQVKLKDGRVYEIYSRPQYIAGFVMGRVWSFRDITVRYRAEKERESLLFREREARIEAEKSIALRDDFISIASHELRTPLTPLKMQVNLIERQIRNGMLSQNPKSGEFCRLIKNTEHQIDHLIRLIEDILDVSRIAAGRLILHLQRKKLSELVQDVINRYAHELEKAQCPIVLELDSDSEMKLDPVRMDQVIVNLLTNAMKYGAGQPITISVIHVKDRIEARIKDLGIGIEKKDQSRIFERFERVAPIQHYPGLGLGLFISKQIVNAHGGDIRVESQPGKGATFILSFPCRE